MQLVNKYKSIETAFGVDAKWLELKHIGVKGLVIHTSEIKLSPYDQLHLGRFVSSGIYAELYKRIHETIGHANRIVFEVEYGILYVCVVRKSKEIFKVLKRLRVGLFYSRGVEQLFDQINQTLKDTFIASVNTESRKIRNFFETFTKQELENEKMFESALKVFEDISGEELSKRDIALISKHITAIQ